jgi:phenylpyruvate tautomerase PptA (4-oxalocrotonate tautomerase family)
MAVARLEVLRGLPVEQRRNRLQAVHDAIVSVLKVPMDDPTATISELDPDSIIRPGGASDQFTLVQITLFSGRTIETKRALYGSICSALVGVGVPADDVLVVLVETPTENWGVRGGVPASEVDLGFDVNV